MRLITVYFILAFGLLNAQTDTLSQLDVFAKNQRTPPKPYSVLKLDSSIANFEIDNISTLLKKETSLFIKEYGNGMLSTLSIRGTNANHTKLYWNGIPINSPTLGQTDLNTIPTLFVNSISLHQGAGSIVDGSGGIGGSVQLNNKPNWEKPNSLYLSKRLGSFGLDKTAFKFQTGGKHIQVQTGAYHFQNNNNYTYTDLSSPDREKVKLKNAYITQYGGFGNAYFKKGTFNASIKANYSNSYREIPAVIGAVSKAWQKDINQRILAEVNKTFKNNFIQVRSAYIDNNMTYNDSLSGINSATLSTTIANNIFYKHQFSDSISFEVQSNNYNYKAISSGYGSTKYQNRNQLMGLFEHQTRFFYYTLSGQVLKIDSIISPLMYSGGIEKTIRNYKFKANVAHTYNYPTLNDLYWNPGGNPNLKPEEGINSDFSIEKLLNKKKTGFNLTAFYANTNNLIQWLPQTNGIWTPNNIKKVERKGIETSFFTSININPFKVYVKAFYTYVEAVTIDSKVSNDGTIGKQQIYIPKHKVTGRASIQFKKTEITYTQQFVSKVYIDATNTTYLPWYAPADLILTQHFGSEQSISQISFTVNNIFNEEYQIVANRPMPMRYISIQLTVNISGNEK